VSGGLSPKVKTSRSRTRSRRAQWLRIKPTQTASCDRCRETKQPHRVCGNCGWYNGREYPEAITNG
jgi:large subunit ribosomal protein L32